MIYSCFNDIFFAYPHSKRWYLIKLIRIPVSDGYLHQDFPQKMAHGWYIGLSSLFWRINQQGCYWALQKCGDIIILMVYSKWDITDNRYSLINYGKYNSLI